MPKRLDKMLRIIEEGRQEVELDHKYASSSAVVSVAPASDDDVATLLLRGSQPLRVVSKSSSRVRPKGPYPSVDAYSIEYDGVLDLDMRVSSMVDEKLKDNGYFKRYIQQDMKEMGAASAVLMVGSLRQSHDQDVADSESKRNGSCFHTFEALGKQLKRINCRLDPFLMTDAMHQLGHGITFVKSLADFRSPVLHHHPLDYIDKSKISLLYAQIHKFSLENPGARYFNFIDKSDEVLSKLNIFFTADNGMNLPKGIRLRLCKVTQYQNGLNIEQKFNDIVGVGIQDYNWENRSKGLAIELAREPHRYMQISLDTNNKGHKKPKIKNIDWGREYLTYQREVAGRIERKESEAKEVEELNIAVNRNKLAEKLKTEILKPIHDEIQRLHLINCDISNNKVKIFKSAYNDVNNQIISQHIQTAEDLRENVKSVMLHYSREYVGMSSNPIDVRRNPAVDVFRFLLGVVLSIPTLFVAWGSKSFRNTFFHTEARATMDRLVDVPDLIASSKLSK